MDGRLATGRFAPSPTGRMHLGNVYAALMSWLSVRSKGGRWILRIEDLDPGRSRREYALQIEDDLRWLGLDWDEGGVGSSTSVSYCQSERGAIYSRFYETLCDTGLTYPCRCTRADILSTQAPHASDGRVVYSGKCRPERLGGCAKEILPEGEANARQPATRIFVPDREIRFSDQVAGDQTFNLAAECGDFIIRRSDGAWAYQLAVVVDDALMGITEVVRGNDLLLSAAQQIYLYGLLGFEPPRFSHIPLMCNEDGQRLSKRDGSLSMECLRRRFTPEEIIGKTAWLCGLQPTPAPRSAESLVNDFSIERLKSRPS